MEVEAPSTKSHVHTPEVVVPTIEDLGQRLLQYAPEELGELQVDDPVTGPMLKWLEHKGDPPKHEVAQQGRAVEGTGPG